MSQELRCKECNRVLLEVDSSGIGWHFSIKCRRCGAMNGFYGPTLQDKFRDLREKLREGLDELDKLMQQV